MTFKSKVPEARLGGTYLEAQDKGSKEDYELMASQAIYQNLSQLAIKNYHIFPWRSK